MEILELINKGSRQLKNKNICSHKLDSEILLSKVLNKTAGFINDDNRFFNVLIPIRDGLMVCFKK